MGDKIAFSLESLRFEEVAISYADIQKSVRFYYSAPSLEARDSKFVGYTLQEVQQELNQRLDDLDKNSVLGLLAALEASFQVDFHLRCNNREKDPLSRAFRAVKKVKGRRISFEEDILEAWKDHMPGAKSVLSELKGAFRYRHWLAHGRYWNPKLGKKYDFSSIYLLAQDIDQNFDLLSLITS